MRNCKKEILTALVSALTTAMPTMIIRTKLNDFDLSDNTAYPYIYLGEVYQTEDGPKNWYRYSVEILIHVVYKDVTSLNDLYTSQNSVLGILNNPKPFTLTNNFEIIETNEANAGCPYDLLVKKGNITYAINVKSAKPNKGLFGIQVSNISRLQQKCKSNNAVMGFLMISGEDYLLLLHNSEYSNWIKPIKSRRVHKDTRGHHYKSPDRQRELTRLRVQRFRAKKKEQEDTENE